MLISTMVKPLQNVDAELENKLRRAGLGAWVGSKRGQGGTLIDEQGDPPVPSEPPLEEERTLHRPADPSSSAPPRPQLDSVISLDDGEVDLIESSLEHAVIAAPPEMGAVTADEQLEQAAAVALQRLDEDEAAELSTRVKGSLDDEHGELATAVKPLSEHDSGVEVIPPRLAGSPDAGDEQELATTVMSPEEVARDLELAQAARGLDGTADDVEVATRVRESSDDDPVDLATAVRPQPAEEPPDDQNPTTLMPRSQLSEGLPPHLQRALAAELGPVADTVDDPPPSAPPPPSASPLDRELPPLVEPKRAQRTVPLTAPLPQFAPMPPSGQPAPPSNQNLVQLAGPELGPGHAGGEDDLEQLLRRMPRTRYPVLSTVLALLVMAAAIAGAVWLVM
jgi:hypothetical protein